MAQGTHLRAVAQQTASEEASSGSHTIVQSQANNSDIPTATLRLRAPRHSDSRRIQWAEDVVDNEGMGKKSSKVCCIYHKPHEPGDSESEDSSSSSESDNEPDLSRAQRAGGDRKEKRGKTQSQGSVRSKQRKPSPNAYERQPKHKSTQAG